MSDALTPIRCAHCAGVILMVKPSTAEAFRHAPWLCADPACFAERQALTTAAEGRLV